MSIYMFCFKCCLALVLLPAVTCTLLSITPLVFSAWLLNNASAFPAAVLPRALLSFDLASNDSPAHFVFVLCPRACEQAIMLGP